MPHVPSSGFLSPEILLSEVQLPFRRLCTHSNSDLGRVLLLPASHKGKFFPFLVISKKQMRRVVVSLKGMSALHDKANASVDHEMGQCFKALHHFANVFFSMG